MTRVRCPAGLSLADLGACLVAVGMLVAVLVVGYGDAPDLYGGDG